MLPSSASSAAPSNPTPLHHPNNNNNNVNNEDIMIIGIHPAQSKPPSPSFINHSPSYYHSPSSHFLDACFLCRRRLAQGRDIFIYGGDRAFCSAECRLRQIEAEEEEEKKKKETTWRRMEPKNKRIHSEDHRHPHYHEDPTTTETAPAA